MIMGQYDAVHFIQGEEIRMPEYKVVAKFALGQEVALKWAASGGQVRVSSVAVIMPVHTREKVVIQYILQVDFHDAKPLEFSNRVYEESQLLTLEEAQEAAAASLRRTANLIAKGEHRHFAEPHYRNGKQ